MGPGIRATVAFSGAADCPVAEFAAANDTTVDGVSTSVSQSGRPVTEFLLDDADAEPVFSYDAAAVYRVTHGDGAGCPCACLGQHGCPIHRYAARDGELVLTFHAAGFEQLQEVMATIRERHPSVDVRRLLQPPLSGDPEQRRFVNRGKLTERQLEVLRTAYERGYFERPRRANATELAESLGVSRATFSEHLAAAQRKLFEDVLEGAGTVTT